MYTYRYTKSQERSSRSLDCVCEYIQPSIKSQQFEEFNYAQEKNYRDQVCLNLKKQKLIQPASSKYVNRSTFCRRSKFNF